MLRRHVWVADLGHVPLNQRGDGFVGDPVDVVVDVRGTAVDARGTTVDALLMTGDVLLATGDALPAAGYVLGTRRTRPRAAACPGDREPL